MERTPLQWMIEPLRNYARFRGRACRAEYWWFFLLSTAIQLVAEAVDGGLLGRDGGDGPVGRAISLALFLPGLAVTVRRLHDLDRSGWWLAGGLLLILGTALAMGYGADGNADVSLANSYLLFGLAIIAAIVVLVIAMARRGTPGPNRFGPDPLAPVHDDLARDFA